jgi:2-polyprenyl-6-methoxyphenol hydroxylase-like FAD-dependent oxidoreductase
LSRSGQHLRISTGPSRTTEISVPVLVVGGGTVGLYLAIELGYHGVPCLLVTESETTSTHPKGSTVNARSMEHLRRLGAASDVRRLGIPPDHNTDITFITRFTGYELARLDMPSSNDKIANPGPWGHTLLTPEPIHRANQMYLEPVLRRHADAYESTTLRFGWRMTAFTQLADRVEAEIENVATGARHKVVADYLVGCDGANGMIRRRLGFKYGGRTPSGDKFYDGRMLSLYVNAPRIYDVMNFPVSWHYLTMNPDTRMDCISLDCKGEFVILAQIAPDQPLDSIDTRALFHRAVGCDIGAEVVSVQEWWAGLALVTDHYSQDRVFLAGDSVHLFTPTGGFGFNTGIDDAANLAWKLAAVVHGWGGPKLLSSYETERRPIGVRNTTESGELAEQAGALEIPAHIEDETAQGAAERAAFGSQLAKFREEFASLGIQLGARYDDSPIVIGDGTPRPRDDPKIYTPSGVPGGRAPHYWIGERESLFDRFGPGFTLLRLGPDAPRAEGFGRTAAARGIPFETVTVNEPGIAGLYERRLALVRPDQHIAWRGDSAPSDPGRVLDIVAGHG